MKRWIIMAIVVWWSVMEWGLAVHYASKPPVVRIQRVVRVEPQISTRTFLLQRDRAFQQLYDHWRGCAQTMAKIEAMTIRERYDRLSHQPNGQASSRHE